MDFLNNLLCRDSAVVKPATDSTKAETKYKFNAGRFVASALIVAGSGAISALVWK